MRDTFDSFVKRHERHYRHGSSEYELRLRVFSKRLSEVDAQNMLPNALWSAEVNHFTDLTDDELLMWRGRKGPRGTSFGGSASFIQKHPFGDVEESALSNPATPRVGAMDWKNLTMSSKIPNQQSCGSCWALTSIAILEAHYEIHVSHEQPKEFSAQELVSCVPNPRHCGGKGGCDGATVELAMQYVMGKGLVTAQGAPYQAEDIKCDSIPKHCEKTSVGGNNKCSLVGLIASGADERNRYDNIHHQGAGLQCFKTLPSNQEEPLVRALT
jgi:cathepsin L